MVQEHFAANGEECPIKPLDDWSSQETLQWVQVYVLQVPLEIDTEQHRVTLHRCERGIFLDKDAKEYVVSRVATALTRVWTKAVPMHYLDEGFPCSDDESEDEDENMGGDDD